MGKASRCGAEMVWGLGRECHLALHEQRKVAATAQLACTNAEMQGGHKLLASLADHMLAEGGNCKHSRRQEEQETQGTTSTGLDCCKHPHNRG